MILFGNFNEDLRQWFSKNNPKGDWKRINSKGEVIGPCAREPGEPKPKCMSREKRAALSKKQRASAVAAKRRHDPDPERQGKPINVSNFGKGKISEIMDYLDEKSIPTQPDKWASAKAQARAKFDVYPSAYANGWAAKKYKEMGGSWRSAAEQTEPEKTKTFLQIRERCWTGYKTVGQKKKGNRMVPNCVPEETMNESGGDKVFTHGADHIEKYSDHSFATYRNGVKQTFYATLDAAKQALMSEAKEKQEYDYEGDMARSQLRSIIANAQAVHDMLKPDTNMAEWVQSKITLAADYISTAADYMQSERNEVSEAAPAWTRKEGKSPSGGLNAKGIASYRRANPGSKLSMAVTTPPSKLDPDGKAAGRRRSFCARMGGSKGPMKDEKGEPTRKALALRKWNC